MKTTFWKLLNKYSITIPIIQRDYAQGRDDKKAATIRKSLLDKIKNALENNETVDFDFVYGISKDKDMQPLDGQQRLTTLFLLHWFTASTNGCLDDINKGKLKKFSYQTRITSKRFCTKLIDFAYIPNASSPISSQIKQQPWFAYTWRNDPTITAMLRMLDAIETQFSSSDINYFEKLTNGDLIHFQFLDMEEFNLSDNLYIKMNARGKPLTDFENFKARFEKYLEDTNRAKYKTHFVDKADKDWCEMFWVEVQDNIDIAFMRYFDFIAEVGFYLDPTSDKAKIRDNDMVFKFNVFENNDVLDLLFNSLDKFTTIDKDQYFKGLFTSYKYEIGKVKLYEENVNLFLRCVKGDNFDAKDRLLLYAVILQIVSESEKKDELRLIRNLIINSPNEIRADNMHNLYSSIKDIMLGKVDYKELRKAFSGPQVDDEEDKAIFIRDNQDLKEELYHFEDHYILKGRMSAIELSPINLSQNRITFKTLFAKEVNRNDISRAVLCFGDYSQNLTSNRHRFANSNDDTWHTILTSADIGKIKTHLDALLSELQHKNLEDIISDKLQLLENEGTLDWIYYFIKYPNMNVGKTAIFTWNSNYSVCMLNSTRLSGYWKDPYLWTVCNLIENTDRLNIKEKDCWNFGNNRKPINISGIELSICNDGWLIKPTDTSLARDIYEKLRTTYSIKDNIITVKHNVDRLEFAVKLIKDITNHQS